MHNNLGALGTWHCSRSKKMDPLRLRPKRPPQHIRPTTHPPPKAPVARQNAHQQRTPNTTRAVCTLLTHMSAAAPVLATTPIDRLRVFMCTCVRVGGGARVLGGAWVGRCVGGRPRCNWWSLKFLVGVRLMCGLMCRLVWCEGAGWACG